MAIGRDILPDNFKPSGYTLSLKDLEFGGQWSYRGTVSIAGSILKPSKEIVLNSKELSLELAALQVKGKSNTNASKIDVDASNERAIIKFAEGIPPTDDATLVIDFKGTMNQTMAGFYRAKYNPAITPSAGTPQEGDDYYMFSTQFEACDARQAFPCFDEPNRKATFEFEVEVPNSLVALSNMPEKESKPGKDGFKVVSFEKTPTMSTYLAAWAIGDFEYLEAFTEREYRGKHLPVRVYTTKGLKEQGQYALEHACKIIDFYSNTFQLEYPLPKSDLLAVHEFSMGAMENWGLVTYRTMALLFDKEKSDNRHRNRVAYVVAHELAHQWFGNLVTMDWWNELWLNEGFATWVGWYATDHLHPDWKVWSQFVAENSQSALALDSLRASHPIEVPVRNALEVDQIFDAISYRKGSSVIRMLASHLGVDIFLKGIAAYLKKHAYGNATTDDLWAALGEASGQDVKHLMDPWIRSIGFPVVTVVEEPGQISVRQSRFLTTGDVKAEEDTTTWWIPLGPSAGALTVRQDTVQGVDGAFYKLNPDQIGFYRTNYPSDRLLKLGESRDRLSPEDKIGLMGDASALALSGDANTAALLTLLENFRDEENHLVWSQISSSLGRVRSVFAKHEKISAGLKNFTLKLVSSAAESSGWGFEDSGDFLTIQRGKLLLALAGGAGHEGIIAESKKRYEAWRSGQPLHPNLRGVILNMSVANGGQEEYETVKREYLTSTSANDKDAALQALTRTKDLALAWNLLEFVMSKVPTQDSHIVANGIASNNYTRDEVWKFTKTEWKQLIDRLGISNIIVDRWLKMGLDNYASLETGRDIANFFLDKDTTAYDRALVVISDTIKTNANYRERDEKLVLQWLQAHKYVE